MLIIKFALLIVLILFCVSVIRFIWLVRVGYKLVEQTEPYQQTAAKATQTVLFIGDSTAVGVGAEKQEHSIAGRFGKDYPESTIVNLGVSGQRLHGLVKVIEALPPTASYDLVVIQIGANDLTHFTNLKAVRTDLEKVLTQATKVGKRILVLTSNDVGLAPIFPRYVGPMVRAQDSRVRAIFRQVVPQFGATYVDLYEPKDSEPFLTDIDRFYAADLFHPSGDGYALWYQKLREHM